VRGSLADTLAAQGLAVATAADAPTALDQVQRKRPSVVILDLRLPGADGMEALQRLRALAPEVSVIVLTGYGDVLSAAEAMRLGADDYLTKPAPAERILLTVQRALQRHRCAAPVEMPGHGLSEASLLGWLMGPSPQIQEVVRQLRMVGQSDSTVLVEGETGAGKEVVARLIHEISARRERSFVALDCGAIPGTLLESELFGYDKGPFSGTVRRREGHVRLAAGGSLFFDEVTNLPLTTQAKLLRVLQDREVAVPGSPRPAPVDVRVIAASSISLSGEVAAGRFRRDLYHRISESVIVLPALRERPADIPYLTRRFAAEASMELHRPVHGLSEAALQALMHHSWPGNVRELRDVVRRAVLLSSDVIGPEHVVTAPGGSPPEGTTGMPTPALGLKAVATMATAEAERRAIRQALQATNGNKSGASRLLRTDYKTLHLKMKRYAIDAREFMR
jgi:two-component system nitrogen regulation response regulator GlnG